MTRTALLLAACTVLTGWSVARAQQSGETVAGPLPSAKDQAPVSAVPETVSPKIAVAAAPCPCCERPACSTCVAGRFKGDRGHLLHKKCFEPKRCVACYIDCAALPGRCCCQNNPCLLKHMWGWISYCPASPKDSCPCCICPLFVCTHHPTAQAYPCPGAVEIPIVNAGDGSGCVALPAAAPAPQH